MGSGELCQVNPVRALKVGRSHPLLSLVTLTQRLTGTTREGDTGIMAGQEWRQEPFSL